MLWYWILFRPSVLADFLCCHSSRWRWTHASFLASGSLAFTTVPPLMLKVSPCNCRWAVGLQHPTWCLSGWEGMQGCLVTAPHMVFIDCRSGLVTAHDNGHDAHPHSALGLLCHHSCGGYCGLWVEGQALHVVSASRSKGRTCNPSAGRKVLFPCLGKFSGRSLACEFHYNLRRQMSRLSSAFVGMGGVWLD